MKLIPNWRKAWRMFSVQSMAISQAALLTWVSLPDRFQNEVPIKFVIVFAAVMLFLGTVGRLVAQPKVQP
jgi:hypothetical protein